MSRPVEVCDHGDLWKGDFHGWGKWNDQTMAIVEKADGSVVHVEPTNITFLDKRDKP